MQSFTTHTGIVAVLDRDNVDTDQIIPKQFLKRTERTGYGECLFYDWRFDSEGKPNPVFPLNAPQYAGASILIAGRNFGCGSSREHAVWALRDYGFRAIIAPSFADIFANNCRKNGLLPIILNEVEITELDRRARENRGYEITVNLEDQTVSDAQGFVSRFDIADFERYCLLEGLDDIDLTLTHVADIEAYESGHRIQGHRTVDFH